MRRSVPAVVSAVAVAVPTTGAWAQAVRQTTPTTKKVVTKRVVGPAAQASRWGEVQVTVVVRKTTTTTGKTKKIARRIVGLTATYPDHTDRSVFINEQAIPLLRQEVLQAQFNPNVDLISGATDTSYAFQASLQSAILKAKRV